MSSEGKFFFISIFILFSDWVSSDEADTGLWRLGQHRHNPR
jgi:hypothetical protein